MSAGTGGCAGPAGDHEEDAHALPEHHPRTFRRAVVDIGHRGGVLTSGMLEGQQWELQRRQLLDVVRWLPELAADTELGRRDWERVNDAAGTLVIRMVGSTRMGCPEEVMQEEAEFLSALGRVATFTIEGESLTLEGGNAVARFAAVYSNK